ncbi:MAG: family 1 glycosylhydrolase [bacterium]|nr:family 1 glycosylhydrolase [bacterium]
MVRKFPDGFYFGAATSAYQVEGGIENNDWAEEARKGTVPVCGKTAEHYTKFKQDFAIAKMLGHNAHRLSVEWARIEPVQGRFNQKEIEHYRTVLRELKSQGMEPFVTLWHFTLPDWLSKKGGVLSPSFPFVFSKYCRHVVEKLGAEADFWIIMNEPVVFASNGYNRGVWPPFKKNVLSFLRVQSSLVKAHREAYRQIKKAKEFVQVGIAKNNIDFCGGNFWSSIFAGFLRWFWNKRFLNSIRGETDFIGINFYFHKKFGDDKHHEKSDMGWDIYPAGLESVLVEAKSYEKPIYVTENGLADAKDLRRGQYIIEHVAAVEEAIKKGVDVRGYFYWSLLDNYEWAEGFGPRFGLVETDYETGKRTVRNSAEVYKHLINSVKNSR